MPAAVFDYLTGLRHLDLSDCSLKGPELAHLSRFTSLTHLNLRYAIFSSLVRCHKPSVLICTDVIQRCALDSGREFALLVRCHVVGSSPFFLYLIHLITCLTDVSNVQELKTPLGTRLITLGELRYILKDIPVPEVLLLAFTISSFGLRIIASARSQAKGHK